MADVSLSLPVVAFAELAPEAQDGLLPRIGDAPRRVCTDSAEFIQFRITFSPCEGMVRVEALFQGSFGQSKRENGSDVEPAVLP